MEYYEFVDLMSRVPCGEQGSVDELTQAVHWLFDHQHDGLASTGELRRLLTSVGEPLTDEEFDIVMKQLTPDGDGKVTCAGIRCTKISVCLLILNFCGEFSIFQRNRYRIYICVRKLTPSIYG